MDFGIMFFFGADEILVGNKKYQLLIDAAKYADKHGFCSVWTPERHFHKFGGLFPNPSVTSAALAMITSNLQIRAGSLISPLHDTIRIAEEWSVVDNLSAGRVAISFGSGWNINDFVFYPDRYSSRQASMYQQIESIKSLWRGERVTRVNSNGKEIEVAIHPTPLQKELPIWITSSGKVDTFISAGEIGANILTHLIGQDVETLASKIQLYREALERNKFDPSQGTVSLMLHTFVGPDTEEVKAKVRGPFREYLRSAISLEEKAAMGGGVISGGHKLQPHDIPESVMEDLLDITFERYFHTAALMGSPDHCKKIVSRLINIGVDEIACLIDFIDDHEAVLKSLSHLNELRSEYSAGNINDMSREAVLAFVEKLEC